MKKLSLLFLTLFLIYAPYARAAEHGLYNTEGILASNSKNIVSTKIGVIDTIKNAIRFIPVGTKVNDLKNALTSSAAATFSILDSLTGLAANGTKEINNKNVVRVTAEDLSTKIYTISLMPKVMTGLNVINGNMVSTYWKPDYPSDSVFRLSQSGPILTACINKLGPNHNRPDSYKNSNLLLDVSADQILELSKFSKVSLKIKADTAFNLAVGLVDPYTQGNPMILTKSIPATSAFIPIEFDFTNKFDIVDPSKISKIYFSFNPGSDYRGKVEIQELKIGSAVLPVVYALADSFKAPFISPYWQPEHGKAVFNMTQKNDALKIHVDERGAGNPSSYDSSILNYDFSADQLLDLSLSQRISIKIKASAALRLKVSLAAVNSNKSQTGMTANIPGDTSHWTTLIFDFANHFSSLDSTQIAKLLFSFNPDSAYKGDIWIQDLRVGMAILPLVHGYTENFDSTTVSSDWIADYSSDTNKVFTLSQTGGILKIDVDKNKGIDAGYPWYGYASVKWDFSHKVMISLPPYPYVSIRMRTDSAVRMSVGLASPGMTHVNPMQIIENIPADTAFKVYVFNFRNDFASMKEDSNQIVMMYLTFNNGEGDTGKYKGTVWIDNIKIGADADNKPYRRHFHNKAITEFKFNQFSPAVKGTIDESKHLITITIPFGSKLDSLTPAFKVSDMAVIRVDNVVQISNVSTQNFADTIMYTVTAEDSSTAQYKVKVNVAPGSSEKQIKVFRIISISPEVMPIIDEANKTITAIFPKGTDLSKVIVVFIASPLSNVKVDTTTQMSGITQNDFTKPVNYTVTAQDGSTATYNVELKTIDQGIEEITEIEYIFPNPALYTINISRLSFYDKVVISDMNGKIVNIINDFNGEPINVTELPAGMYTIIIQNGNVQKTGRFVKE